MVNSLNDGIMRNLSTPSEFFLYVDNLMYTRVLIC